MIDISPSDRPRFRTARRAVSLLFVLSMALAPGCGGVSEEDLDNVRLENQSLELELEQERHKSEVLNRALTNAYRERDRLVDLLNAQPETVRPPEPDAAAAAGQASEGAAQTASAETYVVQAGDTLSTIAQRHNTTTAALLSLNPYLMDRNNYMVWENDKIRLPR
jgi:hypothetical protein